MTSCSHPQLLGSGTLHLQHSPGQQAIHVLMHISTQVIRQKEGGPCVWYAADPAMPMLSLRLCRYQIYRDEELLGVLQG